ncbi:hypothetical protein BDP81DRAFT_439326 [Colletotrichum phormii]|uniref:Uncharacterized protein n=1 Tax=Colletotrichum phormii TaxID=359342 RepID=A0AAI9ZGV0_9PEZI|nr:uncharacterized protein BDP81DRAFT_439326 [Colletotrichum phormii]KAK1623335.1 hypothetical protein BDP81DRAFT_439326 [Colletotrichum phormii]
MRPISLITLGFEIVSAGRIINTALPLTIRQRWRPGVRRQQTVEEARHDDNMTKGRSVSSGPPFSSQNVCGGL